MTTQVKRETVEDALVDLRSENLVDSYMDYIFRNMLSQGNVDLAYDMLIAHVGDLRVGIEAAQNQGLTIS